MGFLYILTILVILVVSYTLHESTFFWERLIASTILPDCFGAPWGYKPRPRFWDLDMNKKRQPILLSLKSPFSSFKAYYLPPLETSGRRQVIVGFPGNKNNVGALMESFWSYHGDDVHMILVNAPGYGSFDEDRSDPMTYKHPRLLEAWLRAIVQTLQQKLLSPSDIQWAEFEPRAVIKENGQIRIKSSSIEDLPKSFNGFDIVRVGRSFGCFAASITRPRGLLIGYTPFQGIAKLDLAGWWGILWRLVRHRNPFPHCGKRVILDDPLIELTDEQRRFIEEYDGEVFTGLTSELVPGPTKDEASLLVVATEENVVGSVDESIRNSQGVTVEEREGNHRLQADKHYGAIVKEHIRKSWKAYQERQMRSMQPVENCDDDQSQQSPFTMTSCQPLSS